MVQLLYASAAQHRFTADELAELLQRARARNQANGVSGVLLYHEGSFLQVLEGPEEAVDATYARIELDKRHGRVLVLQRAPIEERSFEGWSMGCVQPAEGKVAAVFAREGLTDFLTTGKIDSLASEERGRLVQVLSGFRAGRWHQ